MIRHVTREDWACAAFYLLLIVLGLAGAVIL